MRAQVKNGAPNRVCTAFGGHEFVWYEFRDVPAGFERAAREHSYLEVDDVEPDALPPAPPLVVDLDGLKLNELRRLAKEKGVKPEGTKKVDLIAALRDE